MFFVLLLPKAPSEWGWIGGLQLQLQEGIGVGSRIFGVGHFDELVWLVVLFGSGKERTFGEGMCCSVSRSWLPLRDGFPRSGGSDRR